MAKWCLFKCWGQLPICFNSLIHIRNFMKIFTEKIFANRLPMKTISVLFQLILNYNFWFAEFFLWEFLCRCVGSLFIDRRKSVELGSNALTAIIWQPCTHGWRRIMLRNSFNFHLYHRQYPNFKQLSSNELIVDYGRLPFFNLAQQPGRPPFSVPSFDSLLFISWRSVRLIKSHTKINY